MDQTVEQHRDELLDRLGRAIKIINEREAQLAAKDAVILGLKKALKRLERVITELYPGDGEPDEEHIEEYRAVWSAILDAQNALALAAPKEGQ